jgi:lipopolysaccharide export system permease protein
VEWKQSVLLKEAVIKKNQDNLILVMKDGILQISDLYGESLTTLKFSQLGFDINEFLPSNFRKDLSPLEVSPLKVLKNPKDYSQGNHYKSNDFIGEAHLKLATPIAPIALTIMALSAFLVTGFNRKGYSKSIVVVIFVGIIVQAFTASLRTTIVRDPSLSILIYLPSIVCFLLSIIIIFLCQNPIEIGQKFKPNNLKL